MWWALDFGQWNSSRGASISVKDLKKGLENRHNETRVPKPPTPYYAKWEQQREAHPVERQWSP